MLEARGIDASDGKLAADVSGEIGKDDGILAIRRIHVRYRLKAQGADPDAVRRAHEIHAARCPVYRTLRGCIEITTELALENGGRGGRRDAAEPSCARLP